MPHVGRKGSPSRDRHRRLEAPSTSSITPQRKHRKLLKDGSGTEVWPEAVEKIFVQGLREYWQSPWATYSRGRSRWRNQFLVDYLSKQGVKRSKKQVASHMQVLRNMWKGQPEFHLVAGGEELFSEHGLLASTKSETIEITSGDPEPSETGTSGTSPSPTTPIFYGNDSKPESPLSPSAQIQVGVFDGYQNNLFSIVPQSTSRSQNFLSPSVSPPSATVDVTHSSAIGFPSESYHQTTSNPTTPSFHPEYSTTTFPTVPSSHPAQILSSGSTVAKTESPTDQTYPIDPTPSPFPVHHDVFRPAASGTTKTLSGLCLWANGMPPYELSVDSLRTSYSRVLSPVALQIKLFLPSIDDVQVLPDTHGFHGSVTFKLPWYTSVNCVTKVFSGKDCVSEEVETLQLVTSSSSGDDQYHVTAFLPAESSLTRCRWLNEGLRTSITQEFTMDEEPLALIFFDLERKAGGQVPRAQLMAFSTYRTLGALSVAFPPTTHSNPYGFPPTQLTRFRPLDYQSPYSCGLEPANNNMPPVMATSVLF